MVPHVTPLLIGGVGLQEILLILLIFVILFGGKKIPELARGLGRGVSEFKRGMNAPPDEDETPVKGEKPRSHDQGNPS